MIRLLLLFLAFGFNSGIAKSKYKIKGASKLATFIVKKVVPRQIQGQRLELDLYLYKRGGQAQSDVAIYWIEGRRKSTLWQGRARFAGTRSGFRRAVTVDLSGKNLQRGHLEVVSLSCAQKRSCKKSLKLEGGDLKITGRPQFERRGTNTILKLDLKNSAPQNMGACRIELMVARKIEKRWQLRGLRAGAVQELKWNYPEKFRNKRYEVKINCKDMISSNNKNRGRLR